MLNSTDAEALYQDLTGAPVAHPVVLPGNARITLADSPNHELNQWTITVDPLTEGNTN
jgi:hypothetical protein